MTQCLPVFLMALLLAGCSAPKVLTINERQTLIMDAPLLTAGITAGKPVLDTVNDAKRASAVVGNETGQPVAVHYRFYWYDGSGLDVLPYEEVQTIVIPPQAEVRVFSLRSSPDVRQVRLHLFL
ncbi:MULTISPECIES: YcfL family protein [unclassified Brenneria]|uniref:YcfL family protein n=1 Tax=unclassified Brenneria TaxID=2634434 RepID=UPI0018F07E9E|nr:DUF1425 domain-containing protein [Brenneria sp. L3-3C-1]MBJ7221110.1 DUF1425 domain-containing protein [Brenneria sp. L3-3C-1]MEE3642351.1 DUF1425 domain-containing protein [Brenneria sp. L3_3C_1]